MNRTAYPSWDSACRIPRHHSVDWLAVAVWLVLMPLSAAIGWYGLWRIIRWLIAHA